MCDMLFKFSPIFFLSLFFFFFFFFFNLNLNLNFLHHNYCEETSRIISLGQFICENVCIAKSGPHLKLGQVLIVQMTM
jgi:hypothetical protein